MQYTHFQKCNACNDGLGVHTEYGQVANIVTKNFKYSAGIGLEIQTNDKKFFSVVFENSTLYEETFRLKKGQSLMFKGVYENNYFNIFYIHVV